MENINEIATLISTIGFPITACCVMFYINFKNEEKHREEINKMTEALNNNTIAITKLSERIGENNE